MLQGVNGTAQHKPTVRQSSKPQSPHSREAGEGGSLRSCLAGLGPGMWRAERTHRPGRGPGCHPDSKHRAWELAKARIQG